MKVTITLDIHSCVDCPYRKYYREQGFASYLCNHPKTKAYSRCSDCDIPEDCPFLKEKKETISDYDRGFQDGMQWERDNPPVRSNY